MGVVVRRYIDFFILLIPTPLVLAPFAAASILYTLFIFKMFFHSSLLYVFLCNIANVAKATF